MAILFDWYENPKPSDKEQGEKTLHPRLKYNGSIGTDVLSRRIQERCSLTETDVTAVLDALSHIMGQELANGRQVHLDGIGYFRPCLTSTEPVTKLVVARPYYGTRNDRYQTKGYQSKIESDPVSCRSDIEK